MKRLPEIWLSASIIGLLIIIFSVCSAPTVVEAQSSPTKVHRVGGQLTGTDIFRFKDGPNACYVARTYDARSVSISCLHD